MNSVDLIYQESQTLPESLRHEVLDFIGYLKMRHIAATSTIDLQKKVADLETAFAPYRKNFSGFAFNREEANER